LDTGGLQNFANKLHVLSFKVCGINLTTTKELYKNGLAQVITLF